MSDELLEGIKTKAGQELITYMNQNYGSSVWGVVRDAVEAIEKELQNGSMQLLLGRK